MRLSLSQRLVLTLAIIIVTVLGTSSAFTYMRVTSSIDRSYDGRLISDAHLLWIMIHEQDHENMRSLERLDLDVIAPSMTQADHSVLSDITQWRAYRVWKDGKLIEASDTAEPLSAPAAAAGFSTYEGQGVRWRGYTISDPQTRLTVEAWENLKVRKNLVWNLMRQEVVPAVLLFPLFVIFVIFGVRYGLNDLFIMARHINDRKSDDLSNLPVLGMPSELRPLKHALDSLLEKLRMTVMREHEFIENAAHELKTPLAALKLQSQLIQQAPNESERNECIKALEEGLERTRHVFDQILTLSRISAQAVACEPIAVRPVLANVMAGHAVMAADKGIDLSLEGEDFVMNTNAELLKILASVLMDNAIKYTPAGGTVRISMLDRCIEVSDSGQGIAPEEMNKVFDRFYRGKTGETPGSGLGLAIASKCADLLGVVLELRNHVREPGITTVIRA
jgi:two-component system sensor histidine kinase QseC